MRVTFNALYDVSYAIFLKLNFPKKHAEILADHLATCDLLGHHSHGVIRIPAYFDSIKCGDIAPKAIPVVDSEREQASIAFINGGSTLGQFSSQLAAELAVEKAKKDRALFCL